MSDISDDFDISPCEVFPYLSINSRNSQSHEKINESVSRFNLFFYSKIDEFCYMYTINPNNSEVNFDN